jgi:antitoxin component YwqK of YwqJK toxin-antitoxin module
MRKIIFLFILSALVSRGFAQTEDDYEDDEYIVNEDTVSNAVDEYTKLTPLLGGDSVRMVNGRPAGGQIKDFYPDGTLKHKGFYANGKLTSTYKNYYPNGVLERVFKAKGTSGAILDLYYSNGKPRLHVEYSKGNIIEYIDYYPSGQIASHEKYDKKGEMYEFFKTYYPSGQVKMDMVLTDKKRRIYTEKIYWENGNLKQEGKKFYNKAISDYQKNGSWRIYMKDGKLLRTEEWYFGDLEE